MKKASKSVCGLQLEKKNHFERLLFCSTKPKCNIVFVFVM